MADSFTYCWTDKKTHILYVGVHKGTTDDGYICSGKYMLEEYNTRHEDFSREIIAHGSYKDMLHFESVILKSINASKDPMFYNKHNGDGRPYIEKHTETSKEKMRGPKTEEHKQKMRGKRPHVIQSGKNNNAYKSLVGVLKSEEHKIKNSVGQSKINWTIISPIGEIFIVKNLNKFCREHNLSISSMWYTAKSKKQNKHTGWQCFKDSNRFEEKVI